jgi:hypothetical protein
MWPGLVFQGVQNNLFAGVQSLAQKTASGAGKCLFPKFYRHFYEAFRTLRPISGGP